MTSVYDATDAVRVDLHCKVQVTQFRFFSSQMTQTGSLIRVYKQDKKCMNLDMNQASFICVRKLAMK